MRAIEARAHFQREVQTHRQHPVIRALIQMVEARLQEVREANDKTVSPDFLWNQGRISELKELRKWLVPAEVKPTPTPIDTDQWGG